VASFAKTSAVLASNNTSSQSSISSANLTS
jgi:hypothetical protein